jgi:hypothetical protein
VRQFILFALLVSAVPGCIRLGFYSPVDGGTDADAGATIDQGCPTWYSDSDGDGLGDPGQSLESCSPPDGHANNPDDCDDSSALCGPECVDEDGDAVWDCKDDCLDADGDGYGVDGPGGGCLGWDCDDTSTVCLIPGEGCATSAGLLGYWSFDDGQGDTATDHSAFGHHGELRADTAWVEGVIGTAVEFDGVEDTIVLEHSSGFGFDGGFGSFSLSFWINPADYLNSPWIRPFEIAYCPSTSYIFSWLEDTGQIGFGGYGEPSDWARTVSELGAVPLDTWTHVVFVIDRVNHTGQTFINGVQSGETSDMSRWAGTSIECSTASLSVIGGYNAFLFTGRLDDMRFYGRVLGQDEVADLYEARCPCCDW